MAKKKKEKTYKDLNWKNPKIKEVCNAFLIADGRLSKDQIIEMSTSTIYYQLKSLNYIKEIKNTDKDIFKTTDKLRNAFDFNTGNKSLWRGSGGKEHSQGMYKLYNLLPNTAIKEGRFLTGEDLKADFKSELKTNTDIKERFSQLKAEKEAEIERHKDSFKDIVKEAKNKEERARKEAEHSLKLKALNIENKALTMRNLKTADLGLRLNLPEAKELRDKLKEGRDTVDERFKGLFDDSLVKLNNMINITPANEYINIDIEIFTSSYSHREKLGHYYQEMVRERTTLYLQF